MRGNGRIFRRKETSLWWCAYYLRGREYRESTGESDEKKAKKFLDRKLKEVHADQIGARPFIGPQQQRITIDELLDNLEADYRLREKWSPRANSNVKPLREYLGAMRALDVTREVATEMIEHWLEEKYRRATINRRTQVLRQAFKLALRDGKLAVAPYIPRLSEVGNERQGFFEHGDFEAVVTHLPDYLKDFCRFAYLTGWRKGAISSLEWSDVSDNVILLRAVNSKTRKPESMPLEGELSEIMERRRAVCILEPENGETRFSRYVFHREGQRVGDFRKAWAAACVAAGIGKLVCPDCRGDVDADHKCTKCEKTWKRDALAYMGRIFHDFRRSAARNMISAGVPQAVAMKITGHRTDAMFRRYAIVNEEQKREALAKTSTYLASATERKVRVMAAKK